MPEDAFTNEGIGEFNWSSKLSEQIKQQEQTQKGTEPLSPKVEETKKPTVVNKTIFMSYGREQNVTPWVRRLKKEIESKGYSVWMDEESIGSGTNWLFEIG